MDEEESDNSTTTKDDESKDSEFLDRKLTEICMKTLPMKIINMATRLFGKWGQQKVLLSPKILPLGKLNDHLKKLKEENKNTEKR